MMPESPLERLKRKYPMIVCAPNPTCEICQGRGEVERARGKLLRPGRKKDSDDPSACDTDDYPLGPCICTRVHQALIAHFTASRYEQARKTAAKKRKSKKAGLTN